METFSRSCGDHSQALPRLDANAQRIVRHAARLAQSGLVTLGHLREALEGDERADEGPVRVRTDLELRRVLERAWELAAEGGRGCVGRPQLEEALAEATAVALGIDLQRLRFARYWVQRRESVPARLRHGVIDAEAVAELVRSV
ncbi:MAG: hypothetical protein DCC58_12040 [Chloroflexi bacterium]|nr:MAG: hypothetical protein DCC58_12040 [Chloroflexota bacterium]